MKSSTMRHRARLLLFAGIITSALLSYLFLLFDDFWIGLASSAWSFVTEPDGLTRSVQSLGPWAPLAYLLFQAAQVVFAPLPGETTGGFLSGVLFGPRDGFLYTISGLALGSIASFCIGRWLGTTGVAGRLPDRVAERFRVLLKPHGVLLSALLFAIPQFPKDYFCIALGWSGMPLKVFIPVMIAGRAPCALLFVLKGSFLRQGNYYPLFGLVVIAIAGAILFYLYRESLFGRLAATAETPAKEELPVERDDRED